MPLQISESVLPVLPLICVNNKNVWDFPGNLLLLNSKCCQVLEGHMIWIHVPPRICVFEWFHSVTSTWIINLFTAFTVALNWHVVWIPLSFFSLALGLCVICVCFCVSAPGGSIRLRMMAEEFHMSFLSEMIWWDFCGHCGFCCFGLKTELSLRAARYNQIQIRISSEWGQSSDFSSLAKEI